MASLVGRAVSGLAATGGGIPILSSLVANGLLLIGLLFWDWPIWTAIAALWIADVVEIPFLARRIQRALDALPEAQLADYLRVSASVPDPHDPGFGRERLRRILVGDPPATTGRSAARHFVFFWIPFLAITALFLGSFAWISEARERGSIEPLLFLPFDGGALLTVAVGVVLGELVTAWLDRRARPLMPDTSGFERRFVVVFLIVILGGWILGLIGPASRLIAAAFVGMKTVGDLRGGYLPERFERPLRGP